VQVGAAPVTNDDQCVLHCLQQFILPRLFPCRCRKACASARHRLVSWFAPFIRHTADSDRDKTIADTMQATATTIRAHTCTRCRVERQACFLTTSTKLKIGQQQRRVVAQALGGEGVTAGRGAVCSLAQLAGAGHSS
jgi:hypothetical protein